MKFQMTTTNELHDLAFSEGLVLQGCGGDPNEWIDGINQMFADLGILQDQSKFDQAFVFYNEGLTCILFPFTDSLKLDLGKLAAWRLATHSEMGGTWLSDFLDQHPATAEEVKNEKPLCPLIGQDGNIFNLMGIASRTLTRSGLSDLATEMCGRIYNCQSYNEALSIIGEYVTVTSLDDPTDIDDDETEGMGMI